MASAALEDAPSLDEALRRVAAVLTGDYADVCTIALAADGSPPRTQRATDAVRVELLARAEDAALRGEDGVEATGAGSLIASPLVTRGHRLGTLVLARRPGTAPLDERERAFVRLLARRVARTIETLRWLEQAQEAEAVLSTLFGGAPVPVAVLDRDLRYVRVNEAMAAVHGRPVEALLGRRPDEVVEGLPAHVTAELEWVRDTGEAVADRYESLPQPGDGGVREVLATYLPIATPDGPVTGVGVIAQDITERRRQERERERMLVAERAARLELEAGHRRATVLAEIAAVFQAHLDMRGALERVVELLVRERVADVVAVDVLEPSGRLRRLAVAARAPLGRDAARDAMARTRVGPDDREHPIAVAARERRRVHTVIDADLRRRTAPDAAHLRALEAIELREGLCEPLVAGGDVVGVLSLGYARTPRLDVEDPELLTDLTGRLGLAVGNARSAEERKRVMSQLQSALVPPRLPLVPGIELAWRHVAGAEGLDVGGDFFDVFPGGDGGGGVWTVVIGDVCGKGADAAVMTAMARHTVRALAADRTDPADLLVRTNAALLRGGGDELRFVTMVVGRLVCLTHGARLDLACAGHPPPLLLRADGSTAVLGVRGPLLGVRDDPTYLTRGIDLAPDDAVVLYTDGLTDVRGAGTSPEELAVLAGRAAADGPEGVASALEAHAKRGGRLADDLALLVIRARRGGR